MRVLQFGTCIVAVTEKNYNVTCACHAIRLTQVDIIGGKNGKDDIYHGIYSSKNVVYTIVNYVAL